ncbi:MAG: hypothetical protein AAB522_02805, partial [Patescibacteria group bacterium]
MSEFKKRTMLDIVPPSKKSTAFVFMPMRQDRPSPIPKKQIDVKRKFRFPKFHKTKKMFWIFCATLFLYIPLSIVFAEMKVEIYPKSITLELDETLELSRKESNGKIVFSEISLSDKRSGSFSSSNKKPHESKATGIVTVFNKNSSPQVLVSGTRFESSANKIYKIEKGIVVPANGSMDTKIIAQSAGDDFNEENLVDFTLPAFKEQRSLKFNTVYAKSKTEINGGFSGITFIVGQEDAKKAKDIIINEALLETKQDLIRKTPEGSFLLAQSVKYKIVEENFEPAVGETGEKFTLSVSGSAKGAVVQREFLEKTLGKNIPNYDPSYYHLKIKNLDNLSFELLGFEDSVSNFMVKVKGMAEFVGVVDSKQARDDIFEKKLKKSSAILSVFPAASRVKVSFRPF